MSFNSASNGNILPTIIYKNYISDEFPNGNRTYNVGASIASRYHLPINSNLTNGSINDGINQSMIN